MLFTLLYMFNIKSLLSFIIHMRVFWVFRK